MMLSFFYSGGVLAGWGDVVPQVVSAPSAEWDGEDSSGAVAAGWSKDDEKSRATSRTPTSTPNEWGPANEIGVESTLTVRHHILKGILPL